MAGTEPPYLNVGTDVSAKYKGAFCEAKVKKVNRSVKVKVILKECHSSIIVTDDNIKGQLLVGSTVEVKQPSNGQMVEGVINKLTDSSTYTVVFDDGDEATLRRSQLCLKGDKHFTESETLDNLPLSHPEHFGTPVLQKKTKKTVTSGNETESEEESDSDDSIPKRQTYKGRQQELVGKVMMYENTERRKGTPFSIPVLIVLPDAHDTDLRTKDHLLVRSFKDSKYFSVLKKELKEFNRDLAVKSEIPVLKSAMEKALSYFENNELPSSWKREDLLGSDDENEDDESSDDEQNEEKDRFVAQLYKFMDDRGTPINKGPSVGIHDLNLYRLFKIVQNIGGYNKVTNHDKWRLVYNKMGLPSSNLASSQMKNAYKKYLHAFEDFYRKLGSTMGTLSRPGRHRHNSGRNILPFRGRDKDTPNSPRVKKEDKEIDDSSSDKSKTTKSDDTSDTDSLFKEDSDTETPKRSVTRRDKQKEEREKRESLRGKGEEKKEEEEKRSTRRDKDDDKNNLKDEKVTPKKDELKNEEKDKEDSNKKRVTRRKSGRGEDGKKEEEDEEEEKDAKKKVKGGEKEEKKPEEKKLTRKDLKEMKKPEKSEKVNNNVKEEKNKDKEDKNSVKDETEEEEEELNFKIDDDDKKKDLPFGTKVKVKYGRGKNIKLYEAKVVEAGKEGGQKTYLVHYAGWNNRYDEWIKRERIVSVMDRPDSGKKLQRKSEQVIPPPGAKMSPKASLKQQLVSQIQKKRGRPGAGTPPPIKSSEFRIPQTRSPQPTPPANTTTTTTTTTTTVTPNTNKNRPTRSNSIDNKINTDIVIPDKKRKTRRSSSITDNSDQPSRESDESTDTDEEMEVDDKIPDLSETGSLSKTPEREEPESELETSIEEEAPELEAMKPIEDIPPIEPEVTKSPEKVEERPKTPEPVEKEPVLEVITDKTPKDKTINELKDKTPKEVKEKPKEVKEKPKEVKDKPKEVKEKPKEVKEKPKEIKEKPKDIKEKLRELKEIKELKDKIKDSKDQKPKEFSQKVKEIKEKAKEPKEARRIVLPENKPVEVKAASIYDFEDTEIAEDFKIEEKKMKKDSTSDFDIENIEDIVNNFLCPDPSRSDRVEEIKIKLEKELEDNRRKKIDLARRLEQFEEMLKTEWKTDAKDDSEKKMKKKDLKDSVKKDGKREVKRGRPPLDRSQVELPSTPKPDPMFTSSAILSSLTKKLIETPVDESPDKMKKDVLDSKTKKEKKRDSSEKSPSVEDDKSDNESKDSTDNLEKKKVKKKIKKKIFGENLSDSSEHLAFSDLTKDNLDLIKSDLKKDLKTPKSACKDKTPKLKESKKTKDTDFTKDRSSPMLGSAINNVSFSEFSTDRNQKRIRSRSVSPVDKNVKIPKMEETVAKCDSQIELNVPKVVSTFTKEVKVMEISSDSAIITQSLTEVESNSSVVASILDSSMPTTTEQLKNFNTVVSSESSKEQLNKSKEDNSNASGDQTSNSGSESPINNANATTGVEVTESSSVLQSSENSNDIDTHSHIKRKRESEDPTPTKKKRRSTKASKQSERNRSKFNGSDSEDTNSSKFPSPNHTPCSPHKHFDSPRPPRSPKFNFNIEDSNYLYGEQKILFITDKMKEIRQLYLTLKSEVANIDKKRKRARRKERDSQSSHFDNESS